MMTVIELPTGKTFIVDRDIDEWEDHLSQYPDEYVVWIRRSLRG